MSRLITITTIFLASSSIMACGMGCKCDFSCKPLPLQDANLTGNLTTTPRPCEFLTTDAVPPVTSCEKTLLPSQNLTAFTQTPCEIRYGFPTAHLNPYLYRLYESPQPAT